MTSTPSSVRPSDPTTDMVWVPGRTFAMGSADHYPEEAPVHDVTVDGFWMDRLAVRNRDFERFVRATGHVTVAERPADPADYPDTDPALLEPSSVVFAEPTHEVDMHDHYNWWTYVPGADWRHPQGPGSSIRKRPDHPVVHLAWIRSSNTWTRRPTRSTPARNSGPSSPPPPSSNNTPPHSQISHPARHHPTSTHKESSTQHYTPQHNVKGTDRTTAPRSATDLARPSPTSG